jgi:hypothetical protein
MNNAVRMKVVESMHKLLRNLSHFVLRKVPVILKNFEQLSLCEFGDHTELMGCFERIEKQDDVLVVETFEDVDLLSEVV